MSESLSQVHLVQTQPLDKGNSMSIGCHISVPKMAAAWVIKISALGPVSLPYFTKFPLIRLLGFKKNILKIIQKGVAIGSAWKLYNLVIFTCIHNTGIIFHMFKWWFKLLIIYTLPDHHFFFQILHHNNWPHLTVVAVLRLDIVLFYGTYFIVFVEVLQSSQEKLTFFC